jgi:hypothetical protein
MTAIIYFIESIEDSDIDPAAKNGARNYESTDVY